MATNQDKIERLIQETIDPVQRATLMILQRIDTATVVNKDTVHVLTERFTEHRDEFLKRQADEDKLFSSFKGAWWAGIALLGVIQLIGGFIVSRAVSDNDEQNRRLSSVERDFAVLQRSVQEHHEVNGRPTVGR